jgi:7-carboxy-7-deazaguanine synthase (Cx14CxxC type)
MAQDGMSYFVKEIFYTLQGEGANTGAPAVFCRFAGCNLWSGLEEDRTTAVCQFCDTDFVGVDGTFGGKYESAESLANQIEQLWPEAVPDHRFAVVTGGEPLLQVDQALTAALHSRGFCIAIETNGTIGLPADIDWVCVSPKAGTKLVLSNGDELKVVWPQPGLVLAHYERLEFNHFFLQPMDSPQRAENVKACIEMCHANPKWRLSLQTHKLLGIR